MAGGLCCRLIEIQQAAEMSHSLRGRFAYPRDPPIISVIPKTKTLSVEQCNQKAVQPC